jgi:CRISPR/Cas system CMR-associated protein Cmr1 (group 7 of RAMP superfamily)
MCLLQTFPIKYEIQNSGERAEKESRLEMEMNSARNKSVYDSMTRNFNPTAMLFTRLAKYSRPPRKKIQIYIHQPKIFIIQMNSIFNSFVALV